MLSWSYAVIWLCALLLSFLIWKEVGRPLKARLWLRIVASFAAMLSLAFITIPINYSVKQNLVQNRIFLLTDGYSKDSLSKLALRENIDTVSLQNLMPPKLDSTDVIDVLGYGLSETELALLHNKSVRFHPSLLQQGIIAVNWQRTITLGAPLVIQGSYNNVAGKQLVISLKAFGNTVDSVMISKAGQQNFQLRTIPKHNGRAVYSLFVTSQNDTLEMNSIPFEIKPVSPLKVLLLASAPGFENRFLKQWLYENNYDVVTQTAISKGNFSTTFLNTKAIHTGNLTSDFFKPFDIMITDDNELRRLSVDDLNAIKNQVIYNGLGLLIQADSAVSNSFYSSIFTVVPSSSNPAKETHLHFNDTNTILQSGQSIFIKNNPGVQPLVTTKEGNTLAAIGLYGSGKIAVTTLSNTYSLMLQGSQQAYSNLWSLVLTKTARRQQQPRIEILPSLALINQQVTVRIQSSGIPGLTINKIQVYPSQSPNVPFEWTGNYWPSKPGWHSIAYDTNNFYNWYVFKETDFVYVAAAAKINATKLYALNHKVQTADSVIRQHTISKTIPVIYFFLLFLAAAAFLWLERKLIQ